MDFVFLVVSTLPLRESGTNVCSTATGPLLLDGTRGCEGQQTKFGRSWVQGAAQFWMIQICMLGQLGNDIWLSRFGVY